MKVNRHIWIFDKCNVCGARRSVLFAEEWTCIEREDYQTALVPEPALRPVACEDPYIAARLVELYDARTEAMNTEIV